MLWLLGMPIGTRECEVLSPESAVAYSESLSEATATEERRTRYPDPYKEASRS